MYQQPQKIAGQKCPNCPNGVYVLSPKSGKIFCDKKCWLNNQNTNYQPQAQPQTPVRQFNQSLDQYDNDLKWKKINNEKTENIRWCNSLNNASLLIAHNPVANQTDQDILTRLYMLAVRIDSLEPKAPQPRTVAPISRVPQQGEEYAIPPTTRVLTQNNEPEINLDDIPFG